MGEEGICVAWRLSRYRDLLAPVEPPGVPLADAAAAVALTSLVELQLASDGRCCIAGLPHTVTVFTLAALQALPVALRRLAPLPVLLVTGSAALAVSLLLAQGADLRTLGVLVAFYTVVARSDRALCAGIGLVAGVGILLTEMLAQAQLHPSLDDVTFVYAQFIAAWGAGITVRRWRQRSRQLEDEVQSAAATERAHIAREVHDVVSRSLSIMLVQAEAARANLDLQPDISRRSLRSIDAVGRQAWADLRGLLQLVRQGAAGAPFGPAELADLVQPVREAGADVELVVTGQPRPLPPAIGLCARRIVQEALTNVLTHAGPVATRVTVGYAATALELEIANDPGAARCGTSSEPGHGLLGMRERVEALGGRLTTIEDAGAFVLSVLLPL